MCRFQAELKKSDWKKLIFFLVQNVKLQINIFRKKCLESCNIRLGSPTQLVQANFYGVKPPPNLSNSCLI